ncbi:helix-turn-helix domain-containing protein [Treponema primitia]|uniref:helix-turn-helix domain-containing protein n=1 Tax=Treponema primitia TaxID=88058 RepID=UPI00397ED9E3
MDGDGLRVLFSRNLKRLRASHGLSQQILAEKANISVTYLGAIERCERWPHPDILARLADALGVEVREFFSPENPVVADIKEIVDKLTVDVSTLINSSLELLGKVSDEKSDS